jgi:hypothetical protein
MENYFEDFQNLLKGNKNNRLNNIIEELEVKNVEFLDVKKKYKSAVLNNNIEESENLFKKAVVLEGEIKILESRKEIISKDLEVNRETELKVLAEWLRTTNSKEMKIQEAKRLEYRKNIATIEKECIDKKKASGVNINNCVSEIYRLSGEISKVINYTSYSESEIERIKLRGIDAILSIEKINI